MEPVEMPDFFDFTAQARTDALFACSSSTVEGGGSLAVTTEAVFLGEEDGVVRIGADDIDSWVSAPRGRLFSLTVEAEHSHVTYLMTGFRRAAVTAMTDAYGPEGRPLRRAG